MATSSELLEIIVRARDEASAAFKSAEKSLSDLSKQTEKATESATKMDDTLDGQIVHLTRTREEYERLIPGLAEVQQSTEAHNISLIKQAQGLGFAGRAVEQLTGLIGGQTAAIGQAISGVTSLAATLISFAGKGSAIAQAARTMWAAITGPLGWAAAAVGGLVWAGSALIDWATDAGEAAEAGEVLTVQKAALARATDAERDAMERATKARRSELDALVESAEKTAQIVEPALARLGKTLEDLATGAGVTSGLRSTAIERFGLLGEITSPAAIKAAEDAADAILDALRISPADAANFVNGGGSFEDIIDRALAESDAATRTGVQRISSVMQVEMERFGHLFAEQAQAAIVEPIETANTKVEDDTREMVETEQKVLAMAPPAFAESLGKIITFLETEWSKVRALLGGPFLLGMQDAYNAAQSYGDKIVNDLQQTLNELSNLGGSSGSGGSSGGSGFSSGSKFSNTSNFAIGTNYAALAGGGQSYYVGELGMEKVTLPRGAQVMNARDTAAELRGGGSFINYGTIAFPNVSRASDVFATFARLAVNGR